MYNMISISEIDEKNELKGDCKSILYFEQIFYLCPLYSYEVLCLTQFYPRANRKLIMDNFFNSF